MQPGTYFMGYTQQILLEWHVYWEVYFDGTLPCKHHIMKKL